MSREAPAVAIIGGGIIGCAAGWLLARAGVPVTVIERGSPGRAAAWAAGGMLSPLAEADQPGPFLDLAVASFERFPGFVEAVEDAAGMDVEYRRDGKLQLARSEAAAERMATQLAWQRENGFDVEWLDGDAARRLEPAIAPDVEAALHLRPDHRVDNRKLAHAVWIAAERAGAEVRTGLPAVGVRVDPSGSTPGAGPRRRVRGVALADGSVVDADHVVVAAGCWSGQLQGLPRPLPVVPVRGQMVALDRSPPLLDHVVLGSDCYVIPRATGRVIVGATVERVGYRPHATADGIATLLRAGIEAVPPLADASIDEVWAGLRPGTPDDLPILGPDPDVDGLLYATGHFRNGILLAPITAEIVRDLVRDGSPPVPLDPFAVDRSTLRDE